MNRKCTTFSQKTSGYPMSGTTTTTTMQLIP